MKHSEQNNHSETEEQISSCADDILYLAPRPVPTGASPFSMRSLHKTANDTYMDFALTGATLEFAVRCYIGSVMGMALFMLTATLGIGIVSHIDAGMPIMEPTIVLFSPNWFIISYFSFLSGTYGYHFCQAVYQIVSYPPVRFNRQRREVVYVAKRGEAPRIIPWEEVIACVSSGAVVTNYGVRETFALKIGLRETVDGDVVWLTVPSLTLMSAISEWEAIRAYMEEGPSALPIPFTADMPEEGTVEYFHECRLDYRERHWYIRYVFGFLFIQFCSGWTLPNRISQWVERLPKASFPKSVREWSKPLPRDQWASPSAELIEESRAMSKFRHGADLLTYFRQRGLRQGIDT